MGQSWSRKFGVEEDGANYPSNFAFTISGKGMCSSTFNEIEDEALKGSGKILFITSGENRLKMANGTMYSCGMNPTETFVPAYHFDKAGYEIEFATPEGKPVAVEKWAMGACDLGGYRKEVDAIMEKCKAQLESPKDLLKIPATLEGYAGIYMPGGHGPMVNLHTFKHVGEMLNNAHAMGLPTGAICHGPNVLRASAVDGMEFAYKDYKICIFPWKVEQQLPMIRATPGKTIENYVAELTKLGVKIQNKAMDDMIVTDRELVTGSSQRASQKMAVAFLTLLKKGHVKPEDVNLSSTA